MRTLKFFGDYAKCVTAIEVVGVDYSKGFGNGFFAHEHGMVCTPWLGAVGRAGVAFGKLVESLENDFCGHYAFIFAEYFFAEILLKIFADNEYYFSESGLNGIVYGVVHYCLAVGAEAVELFESAVTAAHTGSQYE